MNNWQSLVPHPIALAFPPLAAGEFQDLGDSMREHGFDANYPIILFEGKILDGLNRFRAAVEIAKVKPAFTEFEGTMEQAVEFALLANVRRRHLTAGQKAAAAIELAEIINSVRESGGEVRTGAQNRDTLGNKPTSVRSMVELAGRNAHGRHVGARTIDDVETVRRADKTKYQAIKEGKLSAKRAAKQVRAAAPPKPKGPPPLSSVRDKAGRNIHPAAKQALTVGRDAFQKHVNALHAIKRELKELCQHEHGRLMSFDSLETDLNNILRHLRYNAPYTSCPMDDACDTSCKLCRGTQWIGEAQWDGVPEKIKGGKK